MPHRPLTMAEFQAGEKRFVFAQRRDGSPDLVELADGDGDTAKPFTKTELMCPVYGCSTPDITSVHYEGVKRDHYRHLVRGDDHGPESVFHLEGKERIARWVRQQHPGATVVIEQASNAQRERIADVMVTFVDGRRLAIEIQYAALTPAEWERRHRSYAEQGIQDLWLFGHVGAQLPEGRQWTSPFNPTQAAVAATGMPVLWFNPRLQLVAHSETTDSAAGLGFRILDTKSRDGLTFSSLSTFRIGPDGMTSERIDTLKANAIELERRRDLAKIAAARAAADKEAAKERKRKADESAAERAAQELESKRSKVIAMTNVWLVTSEGRELAARFGGQIPSWLDVDCGLEYEIPNVLWQPLIWDRFIGPIAIGELVPQAQAAKLIHVHFPQVGIIAANRVIDIWYGVLLNLNILRLGTRSVTGRALSTLSFLKNSDVPAERVWKVPPELSKPDDPSPRCVICGKPLESMFAAVQDRHLLC